MSVWDELVSQSGAVAVLQGAVQAAHGGANRHSMSHAWLITGPPGSGRSNAARAFAAALLCDDDGCGQCRSCKTVLSGMHPDVTVLATQKLSIGVDKIREIAFKSSMNPAIGRYQIIIVEDADRVTGRGADALLKSLEEPPEKTVWLLCAPTADDVEITIRSRCRRVSLRTPAIDDVVNLLVTRDGIDPIMADHAARAAGGHIGRARRLATDETARNLRRNWLKIPSRLTSVSACLNSAEQVVKEANTQASAATEKLNAKELAQLRQALGLETRGVRPRNTKAAMDALVDEQEMRSKRFVRDELDRVLTELSTWYRDVLAIQLEAVDDGDEAAAAGQTGLVNAELRAEIRSAANHSSPAETLQRLQAILEARKMLDQNVAPLLVFEALFLQLA